MEEIKEIGVVVGTEEEKFWFEVKKKCEEVLKNIEHEKIIQNHILELAKSKIKK
jgi:hypothetical protein